MKYKEKYELNIPVFFIVGVVFLIWGVMLLGDAVTIRKNLKNIYDENVDVSKLEVGNYISVDKVKVLGGIVNGMESYSVWGYILIEPYEYRYYAVKFVEDDNRYLSLMIKQNQFCELDDNVDENGYMSLSDRSDRYDVFRSSYDFKVVEVDEGHMENIRDGNEYIDTLLQKDDIAIYSGVAFVPVSYERERKVLVWACSVLLCALIFIIASKPWKLIEKKYIPEYEFNLVYKEENDENDIKFITELARDLRLDIQYYEKAYDKIKTKVKKNGKSFLVSLVIFFIIKERVFDGNLDEMMFSLGILIFIPVLLLIKLLINMIILWVNQDTHPSRSIMSIFNKLPIMSMLHARQEKLDKCDRVIRENLYKKSSELGEDM